MDDFFVFGSSFDDCVENLNVVLRRSAEPMMELQCVVASRKSIGSEKWHGDKCLRLL